MNRPTRHRPLRARLAALLSGAACLCLAAAPAALAADAAYPGQEPDAAWRAEAQARILEHRRGELAVEVLDAQGRPVPDADVRVEQTQHHFGFGSAIDSYFYLHPHPKRPELGSLYRELIEDVFKFNEVVFEGDMKQKHWGQYKDGDHPTNQLEYLDQTLARLNERGVKVRGHYLIQGMLRWGNERWGVTSYIDEFNQNRPALERKLVAQAAERARYFGERVTDWDVINHAAGWVYDWSWSTRADDPAYGVEWVKQLREVVPDSVGFYFNEGNIISGRGERADRYYGIVKAHLDAGAPIDGAGMMGHFKVQSRGGEFDTGPLTPPAMQYEIIDRFAKLGLDVKITEYDIDAGDNDRLQADFQRDSMIAAFSHPAVKAFVMWGFWEGKHWRPKAALARWDGTLKPAGEAYLDLVFNQWWTDQTVATDDAGRAALPAFYGDFKVTAEIDGRTVTQTVEHTPDAPATVTQRPAASASR